jgi:UDP-N-acetylmuramoyl-L-alanyl-D-glutamate--2,6-diaminopimelate ligase
MDLLLQGVEVVDTVGDLSGAEVTSVELDNHAVRPGALFCCLVGGRHDGHDFAAAAVDAGAVGLLVERPLPLAVPQAVLAPGRMRRAMADVAAVLCGNPADALLMVGVTGTNGKTTVTHLLAAVFEAHGLPCEVIGTLQGPRTTPEAPALQRRLAEARDDGRRAVAMEVSSHALVAGRAEGIEFAAAVFTNLSQDHLDFHGDMESYFEAKASLFRPGRARLGVVCADDAYGQRLLRRAEIPMVRFSREEASDVELGAGRTAFTWRGRRVELRLSGGFHVVNAVAAATTASALGVPDDTIVAGLATAEPVAGRFEVVPGDAPFTVVVDYAHTPDGLDNALRSARALVATTAGRVLCVFGCGGERDPTKRPEMGRVAAQGADLVVVTSDNPRSEDPGTIIDQILSGIPERAAVTVEPDRRAAIAAAVEAAEPGDVVLVAGKGHERTIEIAGACLPFDDRQEAAAAVAARMSGTRP